MTQDEKDKMKAEAAELYIQTYAPGGYKTMTGHERFLVQKGIEAMAAKAFALIGQMEDDHEDALVDRANDEYDAGYENGYDAGSRED